MRKETHDKDCEIKSLKEQIELTKRLDQRMVENLKLTKENSDRLAFIRDHIEEALKK